MLPRAGSWWESGPAFPAPGVTPSPSCSSPSIALPRKRRRWMLPPLLPPPLALKTGGEPRRGESPLAPGEPSALGLSGSASSLGTLTSSSVVRSSGRARHRTRYLERPLEGWRGGYWENWVVLLGERTGWVLLAQPAPARTAFLLGFYCFWGGTALTSIMGGLPCPGTSGCGGFASLQGRATCHRRHKHRITE